MASIWNDPDTAPSEPTLDEVRRRVEYRRTVGTAANPLPEGGVVNILIRILNEGCDDDAWLLRELTQARADAQAAQDRYAALAATTVSVEAGIEALLCEVENDLDGAPDPHYTIRKGGVDLPYMRDALQKLLDAAPPIGSVNLSQADYPATLSDDTDGPGGGG